MDNQIIRNNKPAMGCSIWWRPVYSCWLEWYYPNITGRYYMDSPNLEYYKDIIQCSVWWWSVCCGWGEWYYSHITGWRQLDSANLGNYCLSYGYYIWRRTVRSCYGYLWESYHLN